MIKQLDDSRIKEVMDIWLKTNIDAHNFIHKQYWIDNYDVVINEYMPNSTTFVYEEDHTIKGFISITGNSFIGALFVLEDHQGKGIGRKLLDHCKSLYKSLGLGVYKENKKAVNFYKHCDFMVAKEQSNQETGFMEYIMRWEGPKT